MKKEERLHRLFGDIDDDLVAQAAHRPVLHVWLPRITAAVATVALVAGLALAQPWLAEKPPILDESGATTTPLHQATQETESGNTTANHTTTVRPTDTTAATTTAKTTIVSSTTHDNTTKKQTDTTTLTSTTVGGTPTTTAPTENGAWYEPKWEDKPIWQRFPEFKRFESGTYTVHDVTVDKAMVEEYLEDVDLYGYDVYTETGYDIQGKVYRIKGINPACAVALQYPDRTDFFPAVCSKYQPATLGEFIADLNLREHLRVGTVYHSYRDASGTYHDKEYAGLTVEKVWEMLLFDDALSNEYDEENWQNHFDTKISIRIDMPLLGYENISISLSENGYLRTNLLDTAKLFYIGEDTVDAFMEYVEKNCRLQKDDELIPVSNDTDAVTGTTMTTPAQPPLVTETTAN